MGETVLQVENLRTQFYTRRGVARAVDGVSFEVKRGEILGLVGESGCGKSVTCLSILRLIPKSVGNIAGGKVLLEGRDLMALSEGEMRDIRGKKISMVLQDPMTSLNPVFSIGDQVSEPIRFHQKVDRSNIKGRVVDILRQVRIPSPEVRIGSYPHQFSGGMRQRVVMAMALACQPNLLIADEPTTALDVTIQAQILRLLKQIQAQYNIGVILITHDFGIVAKVCDRVAVMYAGKIVECADVRRIFKTPAHPYTIGLINSIPKLGMKRDTLFSIEGQPPSLVDLPQGCCFYDRCSYRMSVCLEQYPDELELDEGHYVRCWRKGDVQ